ncbi:MAG: arginase [Fimbriimonadaceae bacterium]|jgi:arginase|nr:arginase [Fimbriimonadaceae bacterium]
MIELIGVPFDLTGKWQGSRLGPDALRLAGIADTLRGMGERVTDLGDLTRYREETVEGGIRNFRPLAACVTALRKVVKTSLENDAMPIIMGGEHAVSLGGIAAALDHFKDVALLWIDAHADMNVPATSPSGNLHGMPLAALWGLASGVEGIRHAQWQQLLEIVGPTRLKPECTAWFGLREVDPGERPHVIAPSPAFAVAMDHIDRHGVEASLDRFDDWMRAQGCKNLWVSFDCDALDPILAPGTGTTVRGGLTYREGHLLAELLREKLDKPDCPYALVGLDLMEVNPIRDTTNMTAAVTVEWAASVFGKTISGKR